MDDSFRSHVQSVAGHWVILVLGLIGFFGFFSIGFIENHWQRLTVALWILLLFVLVAQFLAWRDERRARMAYPAADLASDVKALVDGLDKFIEKVQFEKKHQPAGLYFEGDEWLTQGITDAEIFGRDIRHRLRIHKERLKKAGIHGSPLDSTGKHTNVLDMARALRDHADFMANFAKNITEKGRQ